MQLKLRQNSAYYCVGLLLLTVIIILRLYLTVWLTDYVNRVLHNLEGYRGSIQDLSIDLYRGAYHISELEIHKLHGKFPVPFLDIKDVDFSLQWDALIHGRIVSKVYLTRPVLNFAIDKTGQERQTGAEVDWTRRIKDLMPIDINEVSMHEGKLTYRDFSTNPPVNIYIHNMVGEIYNLRNVVDKSKPLPSRIHIKGVSIGGGMLQFGGRANILKEVPDFDLEGKLENVNLPALNDYTDAYASLDFNKGNFSVYSQLIVKNSQLSGYVKPIVTDISVIDLKRDPNPFKLLWESVASVLLEIFKNHHKDQFATKIELSGDLSNVKTDTWSTIGGILHNAFVKAFDRKIDKDVDFGGKGDK